MANYCYFEIHVIGSKQAAELVMDSTGWDIDEISRKKIGTYTAIDFTGTCKWDIDYGTVKPDDTTPLNLSDIKGKSDRLVDEFTQYPIQAKSQLLQCEIMLHYWSTESEYDRYIHYKNGNIVKQLEFDCNENGCLPDFDWETEEYPGFEGKCDTEGEFDNSDDMDFLFKLQSILENDYSDDDNTEFLSDSTIPGTSADLFQWSFHDGLQADGGDYTIAIPDGFRVTQSENRAFEAKPYNDDNRIQDMVQLLPGDKIDSMCTEDNYPCHPFAKKGMGNYIGIKKANLLPVNCETILSFEWDNYFAYSLFMKTSAHSYTIQSFINHYSVGYMIRVQTLEINEKQKENLIASIEKWLRTFHLKKNEKEVPILLIDNPECLDSILKNDVSFFDKAIKQIDYDYKVTIMGLFEVIKRAISEDEIPLNALKTQIKTMLLDSLSVVEFYYPKIDKVMDGLKKQNISVETDKKIKNILSEMQEFITSINIDDKPVAIEVPSYLEEYRKKWGLTK